MPPVISIVGKSESGKTTLIERLIPELKRRGYRIGIVKHAHRGFDMDRKGKDSYRHRQAGALEQLLDLAAEHEGLSHPAAHEVLLVLVLELLQLDVEKLEVLEKVADKANLNVVLGEKGLADRIVKLL